MITLDASIEELVAAAQPRVAAILDRYRRTLPPEVLDDVQSTVMLHIMRRLRSVGGEPIANFDGFVATTTFNCVNDVLRDRAPGRTKLKDRVRVMLTRSSRLASWSMSDEVIAGFTAWREMPPRETRIDAMLPRDNLELAVIALLEANGAPMRLDAIVNAIAFAWGDIEIEVVPIDRVEEQIASGVDDAEAREQLRALWREIRELRLSQRQALLLNLRDASSASAIELLVLLGIATFDEVAIALEVEPETLAMFWNALPLDDRTIAAQLGVTRQQVVNLRRAARERLARRLHNTRR